MQVQNYHSADRSGKPEAARQLFSHSFCFINFPPSNSNFYPPNTFVEAKIQRKISKRGGYFVKLPNGNQGFLKSSIDYNEGIALVLLSKVFFDENKPQTFTDKLKIISKVYPKFTRLINIYLIKMKISNLGITY